MCGREPQRLSRRLALQVQVVGGALLHSKKNGMGYVDTAAKMQAMCVLCRALP